MLFVRNLRVPFFFDFYYEKSLSYVKIIKVRIHRSTLSSIYFIWRFCNE